MPEDTKQVTIADKIQRHFMKKIICHSQFFRNFWFKLIFLADSMSTSSKSIDLSFLKFHGYSFCSDVKVKSLSKAKHGDSNLACKIIGHKKEANDGKEDFRSLQSIKQLSHPHIVPIHSIVQRGNFTFVFMQWLDEGNLLDYIKQNGMVNESKACNWFYQLTRAVGYLHALNFAHGNLTCESLMLSGENLKISGLNHIQHCKNGEKMKFNYRKSAPAFYLPPEVNQERLSDPKKADIYALGSILFMMLNAVIPTCNIDDKSLLIDDQLKRRFRMRTSNIGKLSVDCQVMIHTLLEPDEEKRFNIEKISTMKWIARYNDKQGDS